VTRAHGCVSTWFSDADGDSFEPPPPHRPQRTSARVTREEALVQPRVEGVVVRGVLRKLRRERGEALFARRALRIHVVPVRVHRPVLLQREPRMVVGEAESGAKVVEVLAELLGAPYQVKALEYLCRVCSHEPHTSRAVTSGQTPQGLGR
jgi:hypothetical protein